MKSLQTVFFTIDTLTLADKDVRDFAHIVVPMSVRVSFLLCRELASFRHKKESHTVYNL